MLATSNHCHLSVLLNKTSLCICHASAASVTGDIYYDDCVYQTAATVHNYTGLLLSQSYQWQWEQCYQRTHWWILVVKHLDNLWHQLWQHETLGTKPAQPCSFIFITYTLNIPTTTGFGLAINYSKDYKKHQNLSLKLGCSSLEVIGLMSNYVTGLLHFVTCCVCPCVTVYQTI